MSMRFMRYPDSEYRNGLAFWCAFGDYDVLSRKGRCARRKQIIKACRLKCVKSQREQAARTKRSLEELEAMMHGLGRAVKKFADELDMMEEQDEQAEEAGEC